MDVKIHLEAENLAETIKNASSQNRANTMIFIRRYLDEGLKGEYLTVKDLLALWKALRNRYNHQKTMILLRAHYEWTHLRIQDFKSVVEYNSAMFRISSQMKLCGETITKEDMMEKTFSTFHASNVLLQQQYKVREVNAASLEVNATSSGGNNHKRGCGHRRGRWNGKGKNHGVQFHNQVPRHNSGPNFKNVNRHKGRAHINNTPRNSEGACHRCGGNGHWVHICHTLKHLVNMYEAFFKEKGVETNFIDQAKPMDIPDPLYDLSRQLNTTHVEVSDFMVERGNEVYRSD
ncbi:uncharacterized protein [Pyrus communis]|uniref:uncharacterized protein n=1 Tax=Pyrus communis TaxID=23211 RepID=UPI0035BF911A